MTVLKKPGQNFLPVGTQLGTNIARQKTTMLFWEHIEKR